MEQAMGQLLSVQGDSPWHGGSSQDPSICWHHVRMQKRIVSSLKGKDAEDAGPFPQHMAKMQTSQLVCMALSTESSPAASSTLREEGNTLSGSGSPQWYPSP